MTPNPTTTKPTKRPSEPKPKDSAPRHEIKRLLPRHFKMLDLMATGMSKADIARTLGCSVQNVWIVSRSPIFIAELNRRMKQRNLNGVAEEREAVESKARSILEQASIEAAETQRELLHSEDDSVRLRASGSILDRVLGRHESDRAAVNVQINAQDAHLLTLALQESRECEKYDLKSIESQEKEV